MSNVGSELKKYVPSGKTQKTVALELAEALKEQLGIQYSADTAESRWSEALKGKLTGLRFFFESEQRMDTTLRALGVSSADQPRVRQLLRAAMGARTLVVDLTSARRELDPPVFEKLRTWFLTFEGELQVVVTLTDAQYDLAPPTFRECGARFERNDVARHIEGAAIVASENQVRPFEKWLAVNFDSTFPVSPENWLERIREGQSLESLPTPARPGTLIAEAGAADDSDLPRGIKLRKLMLALANADLAALEAARIYQRALPDRLRLGIRLDVACAATEDEWQKAREQGTDSIEPGRLTTVLAAARLTGAALALRAAERIHLVNPTERQKQLLESPLFARDEVTLHLEREDPHGYTESLREAASKLKHEDLYDDPYLDRWLAERCREDHERLIARSALAWLGQSGKLTFSEGELVQDWRTALRKLLGAVPSQAALFLRHPDEHALMTAERAASLIAPLFELGAPFHPFAHSLVVTRDVRHEIVRLDKREAPATADGWATALGKSLAYSKPFGRDRERRDASTVVVPSESWADADELLARVLDSLDQALDRGWARVTPEGWTHLQLSGGMIARLRLRSAAPSTPSASFVTSIVRDHPTSKVERITRVLATHATEEQYPTKFGPIAPVNMRLAGAGVSCVLTFHASALLSTHTPGTEAAIAKVQADRRNADD